MNIRPFLFLFLLSLSACGDNSPFDEDYWDDPQAQDSDENSGNNSENAYSVTLQSLSSSVGTVRGNVVIDINQTDVTTSTTLSEIPHTLMIGQRSISNLSCSEIAATYPPPDITTSSVEFKDQTSTDTSSVESLITELNQADPSNGDGVNLTGKSYVVKAYIQTINTPIPQTTSLIPVACGTIIAGVPGEDSGETDGEQEDGGGTIGATTGSVGGTIGATTGGATGGTVGSTGGGTIGSVGGSISGSTGF